MNLGFSIQLGKFQLHFGKPKIENEMGEFLHFAINALLGDGPDELAIEASATHLQFRSLIEGRRIETLPAEIALMREQHGWPEDVMAFTEQYLAEHLGEYSKGAARELAWERHGNKVRIFWREHAAA